MSNNLLQEAISKLQTAITEHSVILPRIESKLDRINGNIVEHEKRITKCENELDHKDKSVNRWIAPVITASLTGLILTFLSFFVNA